MALCVEPPALRVGSRGESLQPVGADEIQVGVVGLRLEHPLACPFVEVTSRRVACLGPERNVLAVAPAGQRRRVDPSGMCAERRLYDRQHPVRGDAHPVAEALQRRDDLLDGGDHAALGRPSRPWPL